MSRRREFTALAARLLALATAAMVAGCAPQTASKRDAYAMPLRDDYLQLVTVSDRSVEVGGAGRTVRAAAPDGHCISIDSIQTLGDAVFMLVEGCRGGRSAFPGVASISIANTPLGADFGSLEAFFRTPEGAVRLGYGGGPEDVIVKSVKRADGALYALVEDASEFGPAFAGDPICRAFFELNGRMVVATIISRRDEPQDDEAMQADVSRLVKALRKANSGIEGV